MSVSCRLIVSSAVLLLYGCQVTRTLLSGEKSSRDVFGRSKVDTMEPSEHFTTETLRDRQEGRQSGRQTGQGQTNLLFDEVTEIFYRLKTNQVFLSFLAFKSHDITFYHLEFCLFSLVYITIIRLLINIITFVRCTSQTASRLC